MARIDDIEKKIKPERSLSHMNEFQDMYEKQDAKRTEKSRFWIATGIAILSLIVSIIAILK